MNLPRKRNKCNAIVAGGDAYLGDHELTQHSTNPADNTATRYYTHHGALIALRTTGVTAITWVGADHLGSITITAPPARASCRAPG